MQTHRKVAASVVRPSRLLAPAIRSLQQRRARRESPAMMRRKPLPPQCPQVPRHRITLVVTPRITRITPVQLSHQTIPHNLGNNRSASNRQRLPVTPHDRRDHLRSRNKTRNTIAIHKAGIQPSSPLVFQDCAQVCISALHGLQTRLQDVVLLDFCDGSCAQGDERLAAYGGQQGFSHGGGELFAVLHMLQKTRRRVENRRRKDHRRRNNRTGDRTASDLVETRNPSPLFQAMAYLPAEIHETSTERATRKTYAFSSGSLCLPTFFLGLSFFLRPFPLVVQALHLALGEASSREGKKEDKDGA